MANAISVVPYKNSGYGAAELKRLYQRYMSFGLLIGSLVCFSGAGSYHLAVWLSEEDEPIHMVRIMKYTDLGPPPSLQNTEVAPAVTVSGPVVKPSVGIPVPVPDAEVNPDQTIATQTELSSQAPPTVDLNEAANANVQVEQDIKIDDEGPPPDFVPYEKAPELVKKVEAVYPDIAIRAGLEGNVFVKIWVDKEGRVRNVFVLKSDAEIFNQSAIDAAKKFIFTPAIMQKGPVAVWVSFPFRFRLTSLK